MPQEEIPVRLRFATEEMKDHFLECFPSQILTVQRLDTAGDTAARCLYLQSPPESGNTEQNDSLVTGQKASVAVPVVAGIVSPKKDPKVTNGQNRETNIDINKPTDQSPHQPLVSSAKPVNPPASDQPSIASLDLTAEPQQQGTYSEPSNASASQSTDVSSWSNQPEPRGPRISSNVPVEQAVSNQGAPVKHSTMVTQLSTRLEAEQTQKKKHTVHCFLHRTKCDIYGTPEECEESYDKEFASRFEEFLGKGPTASLASANNEDTPDDNFLGYIEMHLQAMNCPSLCSRLWRYCLDNQLFSFFKYAPDGLLIHSNSSQNLVCTIVKTYSGYRNVKWIGRGKFGKVYQYSDQIAVKEEFRRPLITGNAVLFQRIVELSHPNVIEVLEYIAGPYGKDGKKCFLSVMSYKNQKDLSKQFSKEHKEHLTCVLDYMQEHQHQEKFIFRNYTVLFRHVFEGLCYLKSKGIVHRDIKSSNILVHQNCACESPLQCICAGDGDVTYLLGDMDLLSLEEEGANSTYTCDEWKKMVYYDPAGTIGMKPPESFFRNEKGEHVTTHKSDVWSACVTMMNVLIGIAVNDEAQKEIGKFITAATEGTKTATKSVTDSSSLLQSIMTTFTTVFDQMKSEQSNVYTGLVNNEMSELNTNLNTLKQLLASGQKSLYRSQSFHGEEFSDIYKEKNPLAGILTVAYGAQVLHWKCLKKVQHVHNTQLWTVMELTMNVIVNGIKFVPERRPDATELVDNLKTIPPVLVDSSNSDQRTNNN